MKRGAARGEDWPARLGALDEAAERGPTALRDALVGLLRELGVLLDGHFLLTTGRHSDAFLLMARAFAHPPLAAWLGRAMAAPYRDRPPDLVVGPAMGGVIPSHEVARALGVPACFAEKEGEGMAVRRGFPLTAGSRALLAEDVVTTGSSVMKAVAGVRAAGAQVLGVVAAVDRSGGAARLDGLPLHAVIDLALPDYAAAQCPLCRQGEPLVKPKEAVGPA